jgi:hypothetical protein
MSNKNTMITMKPKFHYSFVLVACILLCWILPSKSWAYDVNVDGIYYNLNNQARTAEVTLYITNGYSGDVVIPSTIDFDGSTYCVTSIGEDAFAGCSGLTSVTFSSNLTIIGNGAFLKCTGLTSMTIPDGVTSIGSSAFAECSGLTSVTIPNSVINIGSNAFRLCRGLTSITVESEMPATINGSFGGVNKSACILYVPYGSKTTYENAEGWRDFQNIMEPSVLATGSCGNNVTYTIYSDMSMVISGTGAIKNYSYGTHINNDYYQSIKKVIIEEGVTSIGASAFDCCKGLASVEIPNSVASIGQRAFYGCRVLTSIVIPNGVTSIGNNAFNYCYGLTSVEISNGVVSIGAGAFSECIGLNSIEIPNSVTSIGGGAFYYCSGLTSIEISNNVISIGNQTFDHCESLISIEIPNSVTSIGEGAFYECKRLTSVTIGNSVTSIGEYAFHSCTGLTSIEIPNSVTNIGSCAFADCMGLTSIDIPNSINSIGEVAFGGCLGLTAISVDSNNEVYDSRDNCNAIIETSTNTLILGCKNTVIPNSVTSIGGGAFNGCSGLSSVEIPNSIASIGSMAFSGCTSLTYITVEGGTPASVESNAFYNVNKSNCTLYVPAGSKSAYESASGWSEFKNIVEFTSGPEVLATGSCGDNLTYTIYDDMKMVISGTGAMDYYLGDTHINNDYYQLVQNLIIEEGVTSIGSSAFSGCIGLTSVTIPSSVTNIDWYAFSGCTGLTSVEIPNSVTTIGNYAFSGCSSLSSVTIPNSVTFIGSEAFEGTAWFNNKPDGLVYAGRHAYKYKGEMPQGTGIVIEDGTLTIVGMAFSGCTGLTSVEIPSSVTSVGENAFEGCSGLTSVEIPNSVTEIGACAFQGCTGLTSIEIPNSVSEICDYAFSGCTSLTSLTIPNSVTLIGEEAFSGCTGLTSMSFPNSVTRICFCAFSGCTGLTSLTIPESVTEIGLGGFMGCTGLTSIVANGEIPAHLGMNSNGQYVMYEDVFRNVDKTNCTLYVPIGCKSVYETANGWSEFQNIVERSILATGSCGDNVTYTIYSDLSMIISGSGAMTNFNVEIGGEETLNRENEEYWSAVKKVTIEEGVTSIGDYAFCDCEYLTSLTIPNSVTSIGNMALYGCRSLSSITIPAGVSIIGADAFSAGLKRIILEDSYEELLFSPSTLIMQDDDPLEYVYLGRDIRTKDFGEENSWEGVESFPPFAYHYNLHTLEIGDMVTYLEDESFSGDPLRSLVIGRNVQSIGIRALDSANEGEIMVVPNNVKRVGDCCLSPSISALVLEKGDDDLEIYSGYYSMELSFCGSESLIDSIYVGRNLVCTSDIIFNKCRSACIDATLIRKINDEEEEYEGYDDSEYYNPPICATNLYIEEGASIGSYYFQNSPVVHVYIKNPSELGDFAFFNSSLESIDFDINGPASIGNSVFSGCNKLTTLTIPEGVTEIGDYAFMDCYGLSSITIPSSLKSIGGYSFYRMDTENGVSRNVYISDLSAWCSMDIGWLGSPLLWGHLIHNGQEITNLVVPNDVQSIGIGAFEGSSLTSVIIPFGVVLIGDRAFNFCSDLATVTFPNSLTRIGEEAFRYCIVLTSVEIPNSVIEIGRSAFSFSGLTSLIIPNSVSAIESEAFSGCNGLTSVSVDWTVPLAIDNFTFNEVDKTNCTLYVPAGSKTAYENAEGWNEFENIVEIGEEPDTDISEYDNIVYIEGAEALVGQQIRLSLKMNNTIASTGFQCDVYLPEGVTAAQDEDGFYLMDISEERTTSKKTDFSSSVLQPDGGLRFMCSSTKSYTFSGNEGEVAYLMVDIDPNMEEGTYPLILRNIEISDANSNPYRVSYVKTTLTVNTYTLGDANNDGSIGVSDFTAIANYIMGTPPASFVEKAADVNVDGVISVSDLTGEANIILYGTVTPNASHAKARNEVTAKYANIGANDVTANSDKEFSVAITIDGNYAYSGYQFDVTLPEGMMVKDVYGQTKASNVFMSGMKDDNTLRVLCASTMGETTESSVVNLTLVADSEGSYIIDIDNAIISANSSTYAMSNSSFLIAIDNDATGISAMSDEASSNDVVYDLTGRKLMSNGNKSSLQKGIYIINGHKITK